MSEALSQLVAQSLGQTNGGLRPRPRARFEGDADSGAPEEITAETHPMQTETPAQPFPDAPQLSQPVAPSVVRPESAPSLTAQKPDHVPPPTLLTPTAPPAQSRESNVPTEIPFVEPRAAEPIAIHHHHETTYQNTRVEHIESPPIVPPALAEPENHSPPEPLLPPSPTDPVALAPVAPPAPPSQSLPEAMPEPEVLIEIGQIDLRPPSPVPAPASPRPAPARALPSLKDYLRGAGR